MHVNSLPYSYIFEYFFLLDKQGILFTKGCKRDLIICWKHLLNIPSKASIKINDTPKMPAGLKMTLKFKVEKYNYVAHIVNHSFK